MRNAHRNMYVVEEWFFEIVETGAYRSTKNETIQKPSNGRDRKKEKGR